MSESRIKRIQRIVRIFESIVGINLDCGVGVNCLNQDFQVECSEIPIYRGWGDGQDR